MNDKFASQNASVALLTMQQIQEIIQYTIVETINKVLNDRNITNQDTYLSVKAVCEKLSINPSTLYRWTKSGNIQVHKVGGRRLYKLDEIKSFIDENEDN